MQLMRKGGKWQWNQLCTSRNLCHGQWQRDALRQMATSLWGYTM